MQLVNSKTFIMINYKSHAATRLENSGSNTVTELSCPSQGGLLCMLFYYIYIFLFKLLTKAAAVREEQLGWLVTMDSLGTVSEHCYE